MKLYFRNMVTTVTTIMILALTAFIAVIVHNRADVQHWGVRIAFLLVFGLVICCFATARDGLDKTIQYTIAKTQAVRRIWFFVMSSGVFLKIAVMEISRILMRI